MNKPIPKIVNVVILGAGNVAYHLTRSLVESGFRVVQIISKSEEKARELSLIASCEFSLSINDINKTADIYILAVPDSAVSELSVSLPQLGGVVVHTSGSTPLKVLSRVSNHYGVFYPFQTFSRNRELNLNNVPFCIEASSDDVSNVLFAFAKSIGAMPLSMDSETRQWLHLCGVFSCNFVNHMLSIAQIISLKQGIPFDLLKPLISETISKALEGNPLDLQTGPAIRGDSDTIKKHIALLSEVDEDFRDLYMALSNSIWNLKQDIE